MRIQQIDFLRGIAIALVLFHHFELGLRINAAGWMGVDLFFVLSGFLVSGLLFHEYKKYGKADVKTFLIRRGFKIYPQFLVFILASIALTIVSQIFFGYTKPDFLYKCVSELLFITNYTSGLWGHTWSLDIEEHFYFGLAFLTAFLIRRKQFGGNSNSILYSFLTVALICLAFRFYVYLNFPYVPKTHYGQTHIRMDGLMFGVLLAWFYNFRREATSAFFLKYRLPLYLFALACLSQPFLLERGNIWLGTMGFTLLYLGAGILLMLFLIDKASERILRRVCSAPGYRAMCWMGYYSYSIYLWHMFLPSILKNTSLAGNMSPWLLFVIYTIAALGGAYLSTLIIEEPFLRMRDKYFPKNTVQPKVDQSTEPVESATSQVQV